MTNEILEKGNELQTEIRRLKETADIIRNYKEKNKKSFFGIHGLYQVNLPEEVTSKVEMLVEIEINSILTEKRKQFEELGKTER